MSSPAVPLDFEALLSRNYRPARVTHLIPQPPREVSTTHQPASGSDGKKQQHVAAGANSLLKKEKQVSNGDNEGDEIQEEKISQLTLKLVSHTPAYARHVAHHQKPNKSHIIPDEAVKSSTHYHDTSALPVAPVDEWRTLPPNLHEVELSDWEKLINWKGAPTGETKQEGNGDGKNTPAAATSSAIIPRSSPSMISNIDASSLLAHKRNPYLDALVLDSSNICWSGASDDAMEKARRVPLILDIGTAGSSVVRQSLPSTRPTPMVQSSVYLDRLEKEWSSSAVSTVNVTGRLHADKDEYEKIVKAKEKKREKMAIDKKERIHKSMGTLELGGGKGRTITSSLMGPGGTERTGRPSRQVGLSTHDTEYIEQLELVYNHVLVKPDLRKVELRQYHRPRLPRTVVRSDMHWQLQVRASSSSTKKTDSTSAVSSSYQQMMMGAHAGSLSEAKIRNEADLSPSEGQLVLLEYCEERPPLQLTKGMASKIVNYYRGDKSRCPVSAGGGDRPTRRKQHGEKANQGEVNNMRKSSGKLERPPRLIGPNQTLKTSITDWIGKPPKKSRESEKEQSTVNVLPEGVTEILHPKVHGPFIGTVEEDTTQTGLISNLFAAPMFRHEPESSDFLMILGKMPGGVEQPGVKDSLGVVLRPMPTSVFTVGQTEPRTQVFAPNTTGEKNFYDPFQCYHIAKALTRAAEQKEEGGLRFEDINTGLFAFSKQLSTALRSRIKKVGKYDKNTQIWTPKYIGEDEYPGVEVLGRKFLPEGVAAYETACAAARRLCDLGIHDLFSGSNGIANVTAAMAQLTGQVTAMRERKSKLNKMLNHVKNVKGRTQTQIALYEEAISATATALKDIKRKQDVAKFIHEELCLAPWHLTAEFIEVHKKGQGSGMMKLTGLGDPSGVGEGFDYIREVDTKPNKSTGNTDGALSAQIKKITGTENDLRKLTMKQMASLLRSYGMQENDIKILKRWDRVHVIRDFSTKAASDGMGDGLERFARGEKMKLSEQKKMYQDRIQEIWRRQRIALSTDAGDPRPAAQSMASGAPSVADGDSMAANVAAETSKQADKEKEESESDDEDEELAAMFENNIKDEKQTNQLVADHMFGGNESGDLASALGAVSKQRGEDTEQMSKDAREFAALQRERQEQLAAEAGLSAAPGVSKPAAGGMIGRKIVRRRVTNTHPDGRQETIFKFILEPTEVSKIIAKKKKGNADVKSERKKKNDGVHHYRPDSRVIGHSMFEEDDGDSKGRTHLSLKVESKTRVIKKKGGHAKQRNRHLQLGKLKEKPSQEKRIQKRKRQAEDADLYASYKRKGTSNRRERGSARERMPHVILADRLEQIRSDVEKRPGSGPFHRPVNRRQIPSYYEKISNPIDLQTIRDKNQRYEYKTTEIFLRDFDLMRSNAVKFNGPGSALAEEATNIYNVVKATVENNKAELTAMADAVQEQMSGKKKKKKAKATTKKKSPSKATAAAGAIVTEDGVAVNLGNLSTDFTMDVPDSDSDDSFAAGLASSLKHG